jgi:hypothetical protein
MIRWAGAYNQIIESVLDKKRRAGRVWGKGQQPLPFIVAASLLLAWPAQASELINSGDTIIRWDNALKYSAAYRLTAADPALIRSSNADDGDRNFHAGVISNRIDILSELEANKLNRYGQPKIAPVPKKSGAIQMTLFQWQENEIVDEIKSLDLATITPLQALQLLESYQRRSESIP